MHRNDHPSMAADKTFQEGDANIPRKPSVVTGDFLTAVQEELIAILVEAGIEPDKVSRTQVVQAIIVLIRRHAPRQDLAGFVPRDDFGNAAFKNVGSRSDQVAAGNHGHTSLATKEELNSHANASDPHIQYVKKNSLGNAAYRYVGTGPLQVAAGDHTHSQFGRAYYVDVYSQGITSKTQARSIADISIRQKDGDTLLVRWRESYSYSTSNGTATASRTVYSYWLYQAGWLLIAERR